MRLDNKLTMSQQYVDVVKKTKGQIKLNIFTEEVAIAAPLDSK